MRERERERAREREREREREHAREKKLFDLNLKATNLSGFA